MNDVIPFRKPKDPTCMLAAAFNEDGKEVAMQVYDDGKIEISVNGDAVRLSAADWHKFATTETP